MSDISFLKFKNELDKDWWEEDDNKVREIKVEGLTLKKIYTQEYIYDVLIRFNGFKVIIDNWLFPFIILEKNGRRFHFQFEFYDHRDCFYKFDNIHKVRE